MVGSPFFRIRHPTTTNTQTHLLIFPPPTHPHTYTGIQQTFPRAVTPSGQLVFGKDMRVAQVAAGRFFSVARQMSGVEGIATVRTLGESQKSLKKQLKVCELCE